jgi:aldehyde dehydrogenase (NAD+)
LLADHKGTVIAGNPNAHLDKKLQPTIILNPSPNSPLMKEEIFGPILPIITFKTIDEAIGIVKGQEKPLVIYFFGKDSNDFKSSKMRFMTGTSSGAFVVNDFGV